MSESIHHAGHEHQDHDSHDHGHSQGGDHEAHPMKVTWGAAASATLHCLTGCAIGEVLGMVIATALGWHDVPSIILAVVLAFIFGYALTLRGLFRAGVDWRKALRLALAADTLSILVMEIVDNGVMVIVPGAMDAGLASVLFWGALAFALLVAFLVTWPINKWIIGRGKGHAVIHAYHH
jgi:putative flippase GtrA